jgi:hypothetical protein
MPSTNVKLVVYVPLTHCDQVRQALAAAGAGRIGNYSGCSFSSRGSGRFQAEKGANPFIGSVGSLEVVEEERIETICTRAQLKQVICEMKKAHPYDEVAYDVYALEDLA